jgi:hypothetical protein
VRVHILFLLNEECPPEGMIRRDDQKKWEIELASLIGV